MNSETVQLIEIVLISIIVLLQLLIFFRTYRQISRFNKVIPETPYLEVSKMVVPARAATGRTVEEIAEKLNEYKSEINTENLVQLTVINYLKEDKTAELSKILHSINTYLIRNRSIAPDFNLMKDITERNADALEEDINLTLSIPLYLGLMGTMLGIVIGLFSMSSLSFTGKDGTEMLGLGITVLLGGVKIAMIASFTGLFLTTLNSGLFYKGSKSLVESKKNEFYTFLQTDLLPSVNQSLGATFESLQVNLARFNHEFTNNLGRLSTIFTTNFDALKLQESILAKIEKVDVVTIAKYNLNVLKELQTSTAEFEKFNAHFAQINEYAKTSGSLIERLNELLGRTQNLQQVAENVSRQIGESRDLNKFLAAHFETLEDYKRKTNESIAEAGFSIREAFSQLRQHIEGSSKAVKDFTVEEVILLKKALQESKTNLGNLEFLGSINADVALLKDSTASQGERLRGLLHQVNQNLEKSVATLEKIENYSAALQRKSIKNYLRQMFNSNSE